MRGLRGLTRHRAFYSQLARLAVPVALQSVLVSLLGVIDVLMVGQLGHQAIAAVGLSSRFHFLAIVIIAGMASCCSVLMSQYWGRKEPASCRAVLVFTLSIGLLLLTPATLLTVIFAPEILSLAVADKHVVSLGTDYLVWSAPLLLLTHAVVIYESGLRSLGQSLPPLVISFFAVAANVVLNYMLIGGQWGAPQLGVAGAALGTDIARLLQLVLLLAYLWSRQRHPLRLTLVEINPPAWWWLKKQYLSLLLPITLNLLLWSVGMLGYHLIASKMGTVALAAVSLIAPIEAVYHAFFIGFCSACAIMLGHRLGRNEFLAAKNLARFFIFTGPFFALLFGVLLVFVKTPVLGLFDHLDRATLDLANTLYIIMALSFWLKVLNFTLIHAILRAGGDNRFCVLNDFFSMWVLGLPITALAAFVFNADYTVVYSLALVEEVVKGIFAYRRVRQGHWLQNLTETDPPNKTTMMSA